jgi:hypothetical protein
MPAAGTEVFRLEALFPREQHLGWHSAMILMQAMTDGVDRSDRSKRSVAMKRLSISITTLVLGTGLVASAAQAQSAAQRMCWAPRIPYPVPCYYTAEQDNVDTMRKIYATRLQQEQFRRLMRGY